MERAADLAAAPGSRNPSLPLPPDLFGPARPNSAGVDLTVAAMRAPLLEALTTSQVPVVAEFDVKMAPSQRDMAQVCYQHWSNVAVAERAAALRRAADALEQQLPRFCALLVKEAFKTWGDAVAEVREAVDFLRYYADEAERIMAPVALPGPTGETQRAAPDARAASGSASARGTSRWPSSWARWRPRWPPATPCWPSPPSRRPAWRCEAVKLLHAAGVPADAVQLLHGPGETVGAALVAAARHRRRGVHRLHRRWPASSTARWPPRTAPSCR